MTRTHELKVWPAYFGVVAAGIKNFEVRKNDRGFRPGDILHLREWDVEAGYTGNEIGKAVTYVHHGGNWGLAPGYVVMGLRELSESERASDSAN